MQVNGARLALQGVVKQLHDERPNVFQLKVRRHLVLQNLLDVLLVDHSGVVEEQILLRGQQNNSLKLVVNHLHVNRILKPFNVYKCNIRTN